MLVRKLLKHGKFRKISFGEFSVLKTTFFTNLKEVECSLDFNPNFCTRVMEPGKDKEPVKTENVWFADFETDLSDDKSEHIPFMVVIDNAIESDKLRVFKGEDCGKRLLDYVPSGSLIYFHNLGYAV
jgi:hypothetical protein